MRSLGPAPEEKEEEEDEEPPPLLLVLLVPAAFPPPPPTHAVASRTAFPRKPRGLGLTTLASATSTSIRSPPGR